jgi:hypothetical protein
MRTYFFGWRTERQEVDQDERVSMQPVRPTGDYGSDPHAAVCKGGHVVSWFIYTYEAAPYCVICGEPIITQCPNPDCGELLPPGDNVAGWVPYHNHCPSCGSAFPWRAAAIQQANRSIEELADVEDWNVATKDRALELVGEIAADKATGSGVLTTLRWLAQRGAEGAKSVIMQTVKSIGSDALKSYLGAHGLPLP